MDLINTSSAVIRLSARDNAGVASKAIASGMPIGYEDIIANENIDAGHKIALCEIDKDEHVYKYGQVIGVASRDIAAGEHIHTHNLAMIDRHSSLDDFTPCHQMEVMESDRTFQGYYRADGSVGTRNYIGILSTVNCSATVAKVAADELNQSNEINDLGFDGVVAITHGSGCAMNTESEGFAFLERVIAGYAQHPNFAFVLIIGLGCETNQVKRLVKESGIEDSSRLSYFNIQETGGTRSSIQEACRKVHEMARNYGVIERKPAPLKHLTVALQCGGSDGYSGITANPALGVASDMIVKHGGSVILGETPEIYGAEHLLINRAIDEKVAGKLLERIAWWKHYTEINGAELNNNPSPGNKAGGLSTILEKSLGAVAKSGSASLNDVLEYAERIKRAGFNFMDSPGYDPVSVTGQIASGSNVVCFTTGRGSVSGYKPSPCLKLATNTTMYENMSEDMDINCGMIVDGVASIDELGEIIFERIIAIASGDLSASESLGYGNNEFVPWMVGAVT
ncbi:UxaA family hydrolase [Aidingimonas halophila]|uniref:Altronate hydrolase/galactarate dehydratase n=1 Tax=Aidingimonas halophila TaxID=574349 RepID=A0A1H3HSV1_9GAMM|nr:altronate dehydratase family protein [Aidingimonas halophila]GHC38929.1 D-galactarate dehydratase [Aidingimonas halophila]SDY18305.1 altronate hydrolase/galactarate dehydratase [Aidingimonas halophila]